MLQKVFSFHYETLNACRLFFLSLKVKIPNF